MGLLLSVLVTCVGVIELLTFYHRVKTRVYPAPIETDVTSVKEQYLKELEDVRDTLTEQLKNLKLQQSLPTLEVNTADSHSAQGIRKSRAQECLPDYLVEEKDCECAHNTQKCLSSEHESRRDVFRKKLGHNIVEVDGEVFYRRSPSPFPSFDLTAPRNSICSVLLEESSSFPEIDERSRSSSPRNPELNNNYSEKVNRMLQDALASHSSADYWEHKKLHVPQLKSRSPSPGRSILSKEGDMRRSLSESRNVSFSLEVPPIQESVSNLELRRIRHSESSDDEESVEVGAFTDEMKDNLDDLQNKKGCVKKRYVKKKRMKNPNKIGSDKSDDMSRNQSAKETTDQEKAGKPFWLIFSGEYTKANNKDWHPQHFCCWQCDESLTGQRYVLRDDHPYCVSCYESAFANPCEKCGRTIGIDSKDLSYKDKHWHEACFLCTTCGNSLVDKQFGSKGERVYCGKCYDEQFASRCDGCHEVFRAGTKKMEYKTRQWHEKCFCCCVCKVPIGTQSFIPREQEIFCAKCYEDKFATRCIKCNKVITSGGVTYKNEPWHRECFTCTHCEKSLAGERFTSRDEKPYCAECFGELFAKRCFACNRPITGIGGTKFISFEDRHWHNDCFFCAMCNTSLVGRGFITDQDDIICPECAKQKLM